MSEAAHAFDVEALLCVLRSALLADGFTPSGRACATRDGFGSVDMLLTFEQALPDELSPDLLAEVDAARERIGATVVTRLGFHARANGDLDHADLTCLAVALLEEP